MIKKNNGFFMVQNNLIDNYGPLLGVYGIAILNVLMRFANQQTQTCFPSTKTISKLTNTSKATVHNYLKKLVALKLIEISKRITQSGDYSSNIYKILIIPKIGSETSEKHLKDSSKDPSKYSELSDELPQTISNTTQSNLQEEVVHEIDINKTYQKDPINRNQSNKTVDVIHINEFLNPLKQMFKNIFPKLSDEQFNFIWKNALEKKGDDPTAAKALLDKILKIARKQAKNIQNPYGWLRSAVENNGWNSFKNNTRTQNAKTRFHGSRNPIAEELINDSKKDQFKSTISSEPSREITYDDLFPE